MENTAYPRRRYERDYRREGRRDRRDRRSKRLQQRYNYRGVLGSIILVMLCLMAGLAFWFLVTLIADFFQWLGQINLKSSVGYYER